MPAIGVHHGPTVDTAWDGPAAEAACPAAEAPLRHLHAWVEAGADPNLKSSYKFPHHEVSADGTVGPANLGGCRNGMSRMSQADIPAGDDGGVQAHLQAHMNDGMGMSASSALRRLVEERVAFPGATVELRSMAEGEPPKIDGHAAMYDVWSADLGGFRERIMPGAFAKTLADGADVRALFNHDPNFLLGRTAAGTLHLEDETAGLRYIAEPPQTQTIRDLVLAPMARGDLTQSSFQFIATEDEWRETKQGLIERDLLSAELFDVSPVTFPAYPQTDVGLRSLIAAELGIRQGDLTSLLARAYRGSATVRDETYARDAVAVARDLHPDPVWNQRMKGKR